MGMSSLAAKPSPRGRRPSTGVPGREALLQVALTHFAKYGYEAATLRRLAGEAGVDVALVARLFGSKAKLWAAVVDELVKHQASRADKLLQIEQLSRQDSKAAMAELIRLLADLSVELPALAAFLIHEISNPGERMTTVLERLVAPFRRGCVPVIAAAIKDGHLRSASPALTFAIMISAISIPISAPGIIGNRAKSNAKLRDEVLVEMTRILLP
jgi:AcrR family transcriptional regulator